jgi:hypothetical protein
MNQVEENKCDFCGGSGKEWIAEDDSRPCPMCTPHERGCKCEAHWDDIQLKD